MKRTSTISTTINQIPKSLKTAFKLLFGIFLISFAQQAKAQACCPEFFIQDAADVCAYQGACMDENPGGQSDKGMVACKDITHTYTVYPKVSGYTYTWTVTGGTPSSTTSNPVNITWGSGSTGYIKVVISSVPYGGNCVDSLTMKICLIDGPQAGFTSDKDTVCVDPSGVQFTNTSVGGSVYSWDFGDGQSSGAANPFHSYTSPGTYTVTLTVQDMGPGIPMAGEEPPVEIIVPCGCTDTFSKTITVLAGSGPEIETDCCFGTMCPGDTAEFCTPNNCNTYNWTVSGGTIISGQGTDCVTVAWDAVYTQPTSVSLGTPGCSATPCDDITTLQVPVLYPNLPITGPSLLCQNSSGSFTLPTLPGTYYTWTVSGGNHQFNMKDRNTPTVNITFFDASVYTVKCNYNNPLAGCSGSSTFTVDVKPEFEIYYGMEKLCEGDTAQYYASGPASWSVSPAGPVVSGAGNMATIIWNNPGIYVITATPVTPANYCNPNAVKVVEVVPLPVLNNITGSDSVCAGVNETYHIFSDTDDNDFIWSVSGGTGNILLQMGDNNDSVVVQWTGSGPWQLEVYQEKEIAPGTVCKSLKKTIDVYPYPAPNISGPGTVCVDAVETYTAGVSSSVGDIQWTISPSNRGTIQFGQGTNSVDIRWHGTPTTATISVNTCSGFDQINVTISNPPQMPTISHNGPLTYCDPNMPNNLSLSVPSGYSTYEWFLNGSSLAVYTNSYNIPNGTFTGPGAYAFSVKVSNGVCPVTSTIVVLIGECGPGGTVPLPFDCGIDFTFNPNPACENEVVNLVAQPPMSGFSYAWDFGDGATSFESPTQHAWSTAGTYTISLTATLGNTCIADTTKTIVINPVPSCTLTATDTIFCPGDFATLIASCSGMSRYYWYHNGSLDSTTTSNTLDVFETGKYRVEVENSFGCTKKTNTIEMYHYQLPVADISGPTQVCGIPGSTASVLVETPLDSNYSYNWSSMLPGTVFTQPNGYQTSAGITTPASLPAVWQIMVDVKDDSTGCINSDTICITIFEQPQVTLPFLYGCEGDTTTLVPTLTPNDPGRFTYKWSDGYEGMIHDVARPGFYSLTITDTLSGCTATADAGFIYPKPDVSLFPIGCADLCPPDSIKLYLPLPLNSNQWPYSDYNSAYPSITWYDNGTQIGSGETLNFVAGNTGSHQIKALVQNQYYCQDSAGVFCLNDDVCCDIVLDYFRTTDASCPETADGCVKIQLSTNSIGGPFTITQIFPSGPTWTVAPGVPFNVCNLSPGTYAFQINSADGACSLTQDLTIGFIHENCCFAAIDSSFIHITSPVTYTSDMVWDNKYYIDDGVMVTVDGAVLDITNVDVVFGECAGIEFINGGYLRANNSVLRPCDIDKTWRGLRFDAPGEFDNIVNECTFKNAEGALYFRNNADAVISDNLFSNCNNGVRVESNNKFNHPISGNRFVTDDFFPDFACTPTYFNFSNSATYGIYCISSHMVDQISQNEFINAKGTEFPATHGIREIKSGGIMSENTFTDIAIPVWVNNQQFYTSIKGNEIEINQAVFNNTAAILAQNIQGPVVEILSNEISNNFDQFNSSIGIDVAYTDNLSITGNVIDGFRFGIFGISPSFYQISNNTVNNAGFAGILVFKLPGDDQGFITCNEVKMRSAANGIGLWGFNLGWRTEISSNCITDCSASMSLTNSTNDSLPLIRNNFLYNYNVAGINVSGYSGNIGTLNDPGLNTLWSNNNAAVDIQSTSPIRVADNFGMFNISYPDVQITSNNPYHSTASCGRQIFNMPSQGNLNINYDCDNFAEVIEYLSGGGGQYGLLPNYKDALRNSKEPFVVAATIMQSVEDAGEDLLTELIDIGNLTDNEQALLKYQFYYSKADFSHAGLALDEYHPDSQEAIQFKTLAQYDLKMQQDGWTALDQTEIINLEGISNNDSRYKNDAIGLLNYISGYRNPVIETPEEIEIIKAPNVKHIGDGNGYLNIYPNPAGNTAVIQLVNDVNSSSTLTVYDASGNRCTGYSVNFVAGTIEMDISRLNDGIYFVTLTNPEAGLVQKGKMVKIGNQ